MWRVELKSVSPKAGKSQRAAIYARYSSDEQRPESIDDQIEICRRYCGAHRWEVVGTYSDAAVTGANILRPEYQRLLQDAERGQFDIVVVEAVDRLSRRLADLANFHDIVDFRKVKLYATDRGEINALMVGLLGAMAQAYLEDLKAKTKRGLTGKIIAGLSAGSLGYGYRVDPATKGKRNHHRGRGQSRQTHLRGLCERRRSTNDRGDFEQGGRAGSTGELLD